MKTSIPKSKRPLARASCRPLMDVANEALDDMEVAKYALRNAKYLFKAVLKLLPEGDVARELARIGDEHCEEWETNLEGWRYKMQKDLEEIDQEARP